MIQFMVHNSISPGIGMVGLDLFYAEKTDRNYLYDSSHPDYLLLRSYLS